MHFTNMSNVHHNTLLLRICGSCWGFVICGSCWGFEDLCAMALTSANVGSDSIMIILRFNASATAWMMRLSAHVPCLDMFSKYSSQDWSRLLSMNLSGFVLSFLSCGVEREVAGLLVKFVLHRKWQHPHYSGEIWKRSFIRLVRPTAVHTNSDRKRGLSKTLFKPQEFEKADFSCLYGRKALWKRLFAAKTMTSWWSRDFPSRVSQKNKLKNDRWLFRF